METDDPSSCGDVPEYPAASIDCGHSRVGIADGTDEDALVKSPMFQWPCRGSAILARYVERLVGERSAG